MSDDALPARREALYRRYRPVTFAELIGQEHVTEPLSRALRTGRTHHAYLFSGPRGCGKTSSARILARSLNCESGPTPDPCGTCESCQALSPDGAGSLDVVEIDAASYGGVEETRELRDRAAYGPVSSRFKVYVIDEAHMISRSGFNALLKLVEEPPQYLVFVFATTEPEKVIPTIRSRTFHYPFRLVAPTALREHLASVCEREGVQVPDRVLSLVVRAGAGSVRDSLSILDQLVSGAEDGAVSYEEAARLLGVTDEVLLDDVVEGLAAHDGAAVFEAVERVVDAGLDPRRFAGDLLQRLRDLILVLEVPDAGSRGLVDAPADRLTRLVDQSVRLGAATLSRHADTVHEGLVDMKGTTSPRLVLELICARLLLPDAAPDSGVLQRLERLERRMSVGSGSARPAAEPTPNPASTPERAPDSEPAQDRVANRSPEDRPTQAAAPAAAPVATPEPPRDPEPAAPASAPAAPAPAGPAAEQGAVGLADLRRSWPDVLEAVKNRKRFAWLVLSDNATPLSLTARELTIGFRSPGSRLGFVNGGNDRHLREAMIEVLGLDVAVTCVDAPDGGAGRTPQPRAGGPSQTSGDSPGGPEPSVSTSSTREREDPEAQAVRLVSKSLGGRKIDEWDNT